MGAVEVQNHSIEIHSLVEVYIAGSLQQLQEGFAPPLALEFFSSISTWLCLCISVNELANLEATLV